MVFSFFLTIKEKFIIFKNNQKLKLRIFFTDQSLPINQDAFPQVKNVRQFLYYFFIHHNYSNYIGFGFLTPVCFLSYIFYNEYETFYPYIRFDILSALIPLKSLSNFAFTLVIFNFYFSIFLVFFFLILNFFKIKFYFYNYIYSIFFYLLGFIIFFGLFLYFIYLDPVFFYKNTFIVSFFSLDNDLYPATEFSWVYDKFYNEYAREYINIVHSIMDLHNDESLESRERLFDELMGHLCNQQDPTLAGFVISRFPRLFEIYDSEVSTYLNKFVFLFDDLVDVIYINSFENIALLNNSDNLYISCGNLKIFWDLLVDPLVICMVFVIVSITLFVNIYTLDYVRNDKRIFRFYICLFLFMSFMILLVFSSNLIQFFFGWEGVGLTSFLLINFWYNRTNANKSALKALIMNRFGDISLLFAIGLFFYYFKTLNFLSIFVLVPYYCNTPVKFLIDLNLIDLIGFFLIIAAVGKSAQFGLHTWLPDAMEGPTPVSALLHAATMVTAGVFLLLRFSPFIEYSAFLLDLLLVIGCLTILFAGTVALVQHDLKKVIAYSTCSQLGYMFYACGLSNYVGSLFHLFTHAFFKALLFLAAGVVIHALVDEQDCRRYGLPLKFFSFVYISTLVGNLALAGFPFFSGYYSKDFIIEYGSLRTDSIGFVCFVCSLIGVVLTVLYSFRIFFSTFSIFWTRIQATQIVKASLNYAGDAPFFMSFSIKCLVLLSIFIGFFSFEYFLKNDSILLKSNSFVILSINNHIDSVHTDILWYIKMLPLFLFILSFLLIFYISKDKNDRFLQYFEENGFNHRKIKGSFGFLVKSFYVFFSKKWFVDIFYNKILVFPFFNVSYILLNSVDRGFFEIFGSSSIVSFFKTKIDFIKSIQYEYSIFVFMYIFIFLFFLIYLYLVFGFVLNFFMLILYIIILLNLK